jgi:hypothetical protein
MFDRNNPEHIEFYSNPASLHLACGHSILNEVGQRFYNYYDQVWGVLERPADKPDVDTSGRLPNGVTYWFSDVDNSRSTCVECGTKEHERSERLRKRREATLQFSVSQTREVQYSIDVIPRDGVTEHEIKEALDSAAWIDKLTFEDGHLYCYDDWRVLGEVVRSNVVAQGGLSVSVSVPRVGGVG